MRNTRLLWPCVGLVFVAVFAGCTSSAKPRQAPARSDNFTARLGPGGTIGPDLARDLYAGAVGPLPGWTARPVKGAPAGSSLVFAAMSGVRKHLSTQQQQAFDAKVAELAKPAKTLIAAGRRAPATPSPKPTFGTRSAGEHRLAASTHSASRPSASAPVVTTRPVSTDADFRALVERYEPEVIDHLLAALHMDSLPFSVGFALAPPPMGFPPGESAHTTASVDQCSQYYDVAYGRRYGEAFVVSNIAHETLHCFQIYLEITQGVEISPFVQEGTAAWFGEDYVGGTPYATDQGWWPGYIRAPETRQTDRTYEAIGFFSTVTALGGNVLASEPLAISDPHNALAVFTRSVDPLRLAQTLATGFLRTGHRPFDIYGPAVPAAPDASGAVTNEASAPTDPASDTTLPAPDPDTVRVHRFERVAAGIFRIDPHATVGGISFGDHSARTLADVAGSTLCVGTSCTCPAGQAPSVPLTSVVGGEWHVAMSGSLPGTPAAGAVTIHALRQSDVCRPGTPTPTAGGDAIPSCVVGRHTSGDWQLAGVSGVTASGGRGVVLDVSASGAVTADFRDSSALVMDVSAGGSTSTGTTQFDGQSTGHLSVSGGRLQITYDHPDAITLSIKVTAAGASFQQYLGPITRYTGANPFTSASFACTGSGYTLTVTNEAAGGISETVPFH